MSKQRFTKATAKSIQAASVVTEDDKERARAFVVRHAPKVAPTLLDSPPVEEEENLEDEV